MYIWKIDFHMKNGEVIEVKFESEFDSSMEMLEKDDKLRLDDIRKNMFSDFLSVDGKTHILINVSQISSIHISEF